MSPLRGRSNSAGGAKAGTDAISNPVAVTIDNDFRKVDVQALRKTLAEAGVIVDWTT